MDRTKYIGTDVHQEAITIAVMNSSGKLVMESIVETKAATIVQFLQGLQGICRSRWKRGTWAAWLYDLLRPHVSQLIVCDPRKNALLKSGNKALRQAVRRDLLAESRKHGATKLLRQIPSIGPIRAAVLIALLQTPHRFRTKRQLWAYSGLAIETRGSGEYRYVDGQLRRSQKPVALRGLNKNHNHDLKWIFKSAAMQASGSTGLLHEYYEGLLAKGMKPALARLTVARKIATITWIVWKKGARFDAEHLKLQAA